MSHVVVLKGSKKREDTDQRIGSTLPLAVVPSPSESALVRSSRVSKCDIDWEENSNTDARENRLGRGYR